MTDGMDEEALVPRRWTSGWCGMRWREQPLGAKDKLSLSFRLSQLFLVFSVLSTYPSGMNGVSRG
jgi:hypothetical protein